MIPGSGRSPEEGNGLPTPIFLPGESHGQRSLVGYGPWGRKESDATEWLTLSISVLVWTPPEFSQMAFPLLLGHYHQVLFLFKKMYIPYNIKFPILAVFKCTMQQHKYIPVFVQPSPPSISSTVSSSQIEAVSPLNPNFLFTLPPAFCFLSLINCLL